MHGRGADQRMAKPYAAVGRIDMYQVRLLRRGEVVDVRRILPGLPYRGQVGGGVQRSHEQHPSGRRKRPSDGRGEDRLQPPGKGQERGQRVLA